jgi:ribonuclease P protein component
MTSEGLPKEERLHGREKIRRLLHEARSVENDLLVLRYLPNREEARGRRILIAVSRSYRGAVPKNRLRRRLRALYREQRNRLPQEGDFFLLGKPAAGTSSWAELEHAFSELIDELAD